MDDRRLPVLPPDQLDDSAERYLASLRSANTRDRHQRQLRRLASIVCRMPVLVRPKCRRPRVSAGTGRELAH
jgi:hypothetical protein